MSSTPQNSGEKSKKASDKDVDLSNSARGVWLVKVPKYISERWETQSGGAQVGKLKIIKRSNMKPMVTLSLDDHLTKAMPDNKEVTQKTGKNDWVYKNYAPGKYAPSTQQIRTRGNIALSCPL